jgi:tellurite resistance protein TerC
MWLTFIGIVIVLLAFDLGVLHHKSRTVGVRESLWLSAFYIGIALAFGGWVWWTLGGTAGEEFLTGFIVEKTLALDNVFLISMIFTFFAIPAHYQHRVLFWGIMGVLVMRAIMIGLGATLVAQFGWILYLFAVFLILTGIKMFFAGNHGPDISNNPLLKFLRRNLRITEELEGDRFWVKRADPAKGGAAVYFATPLLVALLMIEFVDLIFAVDSIPAIFAITTDPYIVYTSNIFAILGLRALYFALSAIVHRFKYLKHAVSLLLVFIGSKIFVADLMGLEKFPATISLGVTFALLAGGILVSLVRTQEPPRANG